MQRETTVDTLHTRLRKLAAQLPGFIYQYQLHPDGTSSFPYASQGIEAIYGAAPEEVMHDAGRVFGVLHPDDLDRVRESILESARTLTPWHESYRVNHPDGRMIWVEGMSSPERLPDGSTLWHGYIHDVTERERAEAAAHLREAALEATAIAVMITDRSGRVEWANPAFTQLTGYPLEKAIGLDPFELAGTGGDGPAFRRRILDAITSGTPWSGELTSRGADGSHRPVALTISPVRTPDGATRHFVAFMRDLTEERARQAQLLQSQKMESVGRLAGGIAHDFNNLLTVIHGTVELALSGLKPEDPLHGDLTDVREAAQRATALTRQLLAFSRQQVLRPEILEINDVVSDLTKMLQRLLGEDLAFVLDLAEDAGAVRADMNQLEQVIVNLAVNARDAMPEGGTLTISTGRIHTRAGGHEDLPPGTYARLTVRDTGVGIPVSIRGRIFEPFFTTKDVGKGTGLGLATVYGIVRQSGGAVKFESAEGRGTSFHVLLPIADSDPSAASQSPVGASDPELRRSTVLVVDDETTIRRITARILARTGCTVLEASGASEALGIADRHPESIDLLVTDVVMPGMNGPELFAVLRKREPALRVLFISGYTGDMVQEHGVAGEDAPFIMKPYTVQDLTAAVRRILDA